MCMLKQEKLKFKCHFLFRAQIVPFMLSMCATIGKTATTMSTFIRFLSRMGAHVDSQVAGGAETLGAQSIEINKN